MLPAASARTLVGCNGAKVSSALDSELKRLVSFERMPIIAPNTEV